MQKAKSWWQKSQHPIGPHGVKGCLQLEDLSGLIADLEQFLRQRGLDRDDSAWSNDNTLQKATTNDEEIIQPAIEESETSNPDLGQTENDDNDIQVGNSSEIESDSAEKSEVTLVAVVEEVEPTIEQPHDNDSDSDSESDSERSNIKELDDS